MKNKLELSTEIYSLKHIMQTCEVYKDYARIKVKSKKNKAILIFDQCRYECCMTMKEFENYLINMENK